jgi:hypothetical protein
MKKLLTRLFFFISCVVLCACPYVDHGTSKAARFTSYEEIQGCYEGARIINWGSQTEKIKCYKICFEEKIAVISQKSLLIPKMAIDSSVEVSIDFDTTYSKTYELIDEYDSDGTLFYSVHIKDFGHLAYRGNNIFNAKESAYTAGEYTKERVDLCDF